MDLLILLQFYLSFYATLPTTRARGHGYHCPEPAAGRGAASILTIIMRPRADCSSAFVQLKRPTASRISLDFFFFYTGFTCVFMVGFRVDSCSANEHMWRTRAPLYCNVIEERRTA